MNLSILLAIFASIGCMVVCFGVSWLFVQLADYCQELRRLMRDNRDLLQRLERKGV